MNRYERAFQGFLYCRGYHRTWAFPREVERLLIDETVALGKRTLQLYGGLARFGLRLDMDPVTSPSVLGNALFPPFRCKSFDVVIVDPPYGPLNGFAGTQIVGPAACLARERIWWLHTCWPGCEGFLRLIRWWTVCPCSKGSPLRILAEFEVTRHPRYCTAIAEHGRSQLRPQFRKYDWSRHVGRTLRYEPEPVQGRLL
jgi:hypothetical protein